MHCRFGIFIINYGIKSLFIIIIGENKFENKFENFNIK